MFFANGLVLGLVAIILTEFPSLGLQLKGRTMNAVLAKEGDINIGQLTDITTFNSASQTCGPEVTPFSCEAIQMAFYAIDKINKRADLLPNITIGIVILDTCSKDTKALEVVTYFGPDSVCPGKSSSSSLYENRTVDGFTNVLRHYKVVGIVGPKFSRIATAVASLMGVFRIPLIGTTSTSDLLSDKSRYRYFLRLTAPDRFIVATIAKVLEYFGWSYVSVVYNYGSYGENAYQQLRNILTGETCIAVARSIPADVTNGTYADIVDALIKNDKAKVVAVFVEDVTRARNLFREMRNRRRVGTFLWIGGDSVQRYEYEPTMENMLDGSMFVTHPSLPIQDFVNNYLPSITPQMSMGNPWILKAWEQNYNCSFRDKWGIQKSGNVCNLNLTMNSAMCQTNPVEYNRQHDAYMVYAQALHRYIVDNCPDGFLQRQLLMDCIQGDKLLSLLQESTFEGVLGRIKFDANGDMLENIVVKQFYIPHSNSSNAISRIVGLWNAADDKLYINSTLLNWKVFRNSSTSNDTDNNSRPPTSACSNPCLNNEFRIKEQPRTCCWSCARCRDNEIVVLDRSSCEACPMFFWPEEVNATHCLEIPADYLRPENFHSVLIVCLTALSSLLVTACGTVYRRRRQDVSMKDSGLHLRVLSLVGMLLGGVTVAILLLHPAAFRLLCSVRGAFYHLSVCLTYAPQLVKVVQIYRDFVSRRRHVQQLYCVSMKSEIIAVTILISVQVVVLASTEISLPSRATLKMPNVYTKYVEIYCYGPNFSFLYPLSYNAAILFAIAGISFMSRRLPVKFNVARLTFASVSATSFCWVTLVPTYFTVSPVHLQAAVLGYVLISNCLVTVIVQDLPLVYTLVTSGTDR